MCLRSLSLVPECWNIVETVISSCGKPFTDLDNGVEGWSDAIYNSMWVRHVGTFCTNTLHPAVHNISQLWYVFSHYFIKLLWFCFFYIYIKIWPRNLCKEREFDTTQNCIFLWSCYQKQICHRREDMNHTYSFKGGSQCQEVLSFTACVIF